MREGFCGETRLGNQAALDPVIYDAMNRPRHENSSYRQRDCGGEQGRKKEPRAKGHLIWRVTGLAPSLSYELVPELFDRLDRFVQDREFFAQPADVHVDRAGAARGLVAPPL